MLDHFARLQQTRRPWLDAETLKNAFHRLAAEHHPDVAGAENGDRFGEMNAAFVVLREPAARLRHLLELESPELLTPSREIPATLGDAFMKVAELRRELGEFQQRRTAATSALARALLAQEQATLRAKCEQMVAQLAAAQQEVLTKVQALDEGWPANASASRGVLAEAWQELSYLTKWLAQLREARLVLND